MERTIIWVIDSKKDSEFADIEVFEGQNKYTKKGIFSGPLNRLNLEKPSDYDKISEMFPEENISQIGKNKIRIYKKNVGIICEIWKAHKVESAYCRLEDKKLHHIRAFVGQESAEKKDIFTYNTKTEELEYSISKLEKSQKDNNIVTVPEVKLYLYSEDRKIKSYLNFSYGGIEIPANLGQESFQISKKTVLRNLQYERKIKEKLIAIGGHKSLKNQIVFSSKQFISQTLPVLCKSNIKLFWGEEKKQISNSGFSCNISYDMDWFSLSGEVKGRQTSYKISDLLRTAKGKTYVEIDNGILFIPKELKKAANYQTENGQVRIPVKKLREVNEIAERFRINPDLYLKNFFNHVVFECKIQQNFEKILKPYQKDGVKWIDSMYQKGFGCCLADDMGLGKTLQTIAFLCSRKKKTDEPVLIVAPKSVLFNWEKEIKKFAPEMKYEIAYGKFDYSVPMDKDTVYLTTYETLGNHDVYFKDTKYDVIIMDEAHYIKNSGTERYKSLQRLEAGFMLALTGTPMENNIAELWSLLNILNPNLFGKRSEFLQKFGNLNDDKEQMTQLQKMIVPFILRRAKTQVLPELSDKTEEYVYCEMGEKQRNVYDILLSAAQNEIEEKPSRYVIKDNAAILQSLQYLRECCIDPMLLKKGMVGSGISDSCKFDTFKEYAENIMDESGKLIVFAYYPQSLKRLQTWCEQKNWNTYYIDGEVNDRQKIVDEFESEQQGVFFISIKAAGVGLNLTSCQYVFIYDPWWNSAVEEQAADRVYRIGQEKPVFVYHFLVKDTIEEKIHELQMKKKGLTSDVLGMTGNSEKLSMSEIRELLF